MPQRNERLSHGLYLMFLGQIITLVSAVLALFLLFAPMLSILCITAMGVGGIMTLVGLIQLRNEHADYRKAVYVAAAGIVFSLLADICKEGLMNSVCDLGNSICSLLEIYFVVRATSFFVQQLDRPNLLRDGKNVWKMYVITTGLSVATAVFSLVSFYFGMVLAFVCMIFGLFAQIMYMGYLRECSQTL